LGECLRFVERSLLEAGVRQAGGRSGDDAGRTSFTTQDEQLGVHLGEELEIAVPPRRLAETAHRTVSENLRLGAWSVLGSREVVDARLDDALALFPALGPKLSTAAGALSGGEQQMMAIGRALMSAPRILLVDELSLGLAPIVVGHVLDAVTAVADTGVTVVLVEQSLNVAAAVCERCVFMEKGEVRFTGPIDELADRGDLARSVFLGAS